METIRAAYKGCPLHEKNEQPVQMVNTQFLSRHTRAGIV